MRYLLFILIVVISCPAYGWEHDDCRDRSYRYDRHGDAPVDKYQYDSDSVYNWKFKYEYFEAPKRGDYHWRGRSDYNWDTDKEVNMRSDDKEQNKHHRRKGKSLTDRKGRKRWRE